MAEWIEIFTASSQAADFVSPLAMAEWIEMSVSRSRKVQILVSASDGGVD